MGDDSRLRVELGPRSYDILIGPGLIAEAGKHIGPLLAERRVFVVTDERVGRHYLPLLQAGLEGAGIAVKSIILPPGEQTKDFAHLAELSSRLLAERMERKSLLIALGGGVIGDLTGFVAS